MDMRIARRNRAVAAAAVVPILVSGCSTTPEVDGPALLEPTPAEKAPAGLLDVTFTYGERSALYAEGARHFLQVRDNAGDVILRRDEGTEQGPGSGYSDTLRLQPGQYQMETFQRSCNFTGGAGCEATVDPAQDRCATDVSVSPRETTRLMITVDFPHACRVEVERDAES